MLAQILVPCLALVLLQEAALILVGLMMPTGVVFLVMVAPLFPLTTFSLVVLDNLGVFALPAREAGNVERGVLSEIVRRVGGRVGCSHIKELATNLVYFVASDLVRRRAGLDPVSVGFGQKSPEERFVLTKELLQDTCLAYCQTTPQGLDEQIGIKRVGEVHTSRIPLGDYEVSLGVVLRERARRYGDKTFLRTRRGDEESAVSFVIV